MTGMTFEPVPAHAMLGAMRIQPLPEIGVLDRLPVCRAPAVPFPGMYPSHDSVAQIFAVGVNVDEARTLERFEGLDCRHELHAVVGGLGVTALQFLDVLAEREDGAPAARTWVA